MAFSTDKHVLDSWQTRSKVLPEKISVCCGLFVYKGYQLEAFFDLDAAPIEMAFLRRYRKAINENESRAITLFSIASFETQTTVA